jgi:hypothetical protein
LFGLDVVRAVAILLVLQVHIGFYGLRFYGATLPPLMGVLGDLGVELFFLAAAFNEAASEEDRATLCFDALCPPSDDDAADKPRSGGFRPKNDFRSPSATMMTKSTIAATKPSRIDSALRPVSDKSKSSPFAQRSVA